MRLHDKIAIIVGEGQGAWYGSYPARGVRCVAGAYLAKAVSQVWIHSNSSTSLPS